MDATVIGKREVFDTAAQVQWMAVLLDPVLVPLHEVPEVYDALVETKKLIDGAVLRMTSRYEESGAWRRNGSDSAEDDVAKKAGSTNGAARKRMQTSKRLRKHPKTEQAVKQGELSEEQAAEVSSGADASPDDEDELLATAKSEPLPVLKKKAAESRARGEDSEARARRLFKQRCMRRFLDHEGMANLLLKLPSERMAEIDAVLARLIDREYADARDRGLLEEYENYAADVVYRLLTGQDMPRRPGAAPATAVDDESPSAGTAGTAATEDAGVEVGAPARRARNANAVRPDRKVLAIIDVRALNRGHVEGDETCEIAGVGPVSVGAIRSMLSDAFLALVIKDGQDVRNVTHLGRQVTAQQRTALEARGWWCERCGSTYRVEIDHDTGWTLTHDTVLGDLRLACEACHDFKTLKKLRWAGPRGKGHFVDEQGNPWRAPPVAGGSDPPADAGSERHDGGDGPSLFTLAD